MREIQIAPHVEGKGRTFKAVLLASVEADLLWAGGETVTENMRPIWAMFGGSDQELKAFMANLASGRKASFPSRRNGYRDKEDKLEILKSSGYQVTWQREDEGVLATIFLPELFQIDPGMVNPTGVSFVILPTQEWQASQDTSVAALIRHARRCGYVELEQDQLAAWGPLSYLFAAYLDRRTRCPIVADGRFYFQLFLACLKNGLASFSTESGRVSHSEGFGLHPKKCYHEFNTTTVGLAPGLAFKSDHETLDKLMASEVDLFFKLAQGSH